MNKIDFVLPWVDGSDEAWIRQRNEYLNTRDGDLSNSRFRDWDNMGTYTFLAEYGKSETHSSEP